MLIVPYECVKSVCLTGGGGVGEGGGGGAAFRGNDQQKAEERALRGGRRGKTKRVREVQRAAKERELH